MLFFSSPVVLPPHLNPDLNPSLLNIQGGELSQKARGYLPVYGFDAATYIAGKRFRDTFGRANLNFSPEFGSIAGDGSLLLRPNLSLFSFTKGDHEAFLGFAGLKLIRFLTEQTDRQGNHVGVYASASLDALYADLKAKDLGINKKRWLPSASLGVGYTVSPRVGFEASYRFVGKLQSMPLSGFQAGISLRF